MSRTPHAAALALTEHARAAAITQLRAHGITPEHGAPTALRDGRNSPCPCGSGAKFKRCCAGRATALEGREAA